MLTISQLARRFGLSRSALLYYDRCGLLRPSGRSAAGYRLYAEREVQRLERICVMRSAGMPLAEIAQALSAPREALPKAIERRLAALRLEMAALRAQQDVLVRLVNSPALKRQHRAMDLNRWVALLTSVGLTETERHHWHAEFERMAPDAHRDFLESLRLPRDQIARVRELARTRWLPSTERDGRTRDGARRGVQ